MIWFSVRDRAISIYGQTIPSLWDPTQDAEPAESENKVGRNAVIFVDTILS